MNKKKFIINKDLLLAGDHGEIIRLGNEYSKLNNLPHISSNEMKEYLAGRPVYLGDQANGQWGMSFEDARRCLYDCVRTEKLIRGIVSQIDVLKKSTNEDIHVVEAGGGTGILAIVAVLAGAKKVTMLEINTETEERTRRFIETLGLSETIDVVFANARNYIPEEKIDLIVCECLHTGLALEPQLQIIHHLGKFLKPNGKLIPEGVILRWALSKADWSEIQERHTEYRNIENNLLSIGKWSPNIYVDFMKQIGLPTIENMKVIIPAPGTPVNTILVEMDVCIFTGKKDSIMLKSGEAEFLGHPHAIHLSQDIQAISPVFTSFLPGEEFSYNIFPLEKQMDNLRDNFPNEIE